jgi:cobalt/nickel transport protein
MTSREHAAQAQGLGRGVVWLLIGIVVLLAIMPLVLVPGSEFGGADSAASEAITQIDPDVEPWFAPIWEPPGGETESLLFALQAALGAGFIGYFLGLKQGRRRAEHSATQPDTTHQE